MQLLYYKKYLLRKKEDSYPRFNPMFYWRPKDSEKNLEDIKILEY